jgi:hypothetical protein
MLRYIIFTSLIFSIACNSAAKQQEKSVNNNTELADQKSKELVDRNSKKTNPAETKEPETSEANPKEQIKAETADVMADNKDEVMSGKEEVAAAKSRGQVEVDKQKSKIEESTSNKTNEAKAVVSESNSVLQDKKKEVKDQVKDAKENVVSTVPSKQTVETTTIPATSTKVPAKDEVVSQPRPEIGRVAKPEKDRILDRPDHSLWDNLLKKYVDDTGGVDYAGMARAQNIMDMYVAQLAQVAPGGDWSKEEQLAYWINAYNVFTVKLIVENSPLKSIKDLYGGKPWDQKWIDLGGKTYSLNDIENGIIRPQFNDARIHFAVNCAAKSCPPLGNKAYTAKNLNSLLDSSTKAFINNPKYNQLSNRSAVISKIFEWYAKDFGDLPSYFNKYATSPIDKNASITYNEYDWSLNSK